MSIENTADVDEEGRSVDSNDTKRRERTNETTDNAPIDRQGLTAASDTKAVEQPKQPRQVDDKDLVEPGHSGEEQVTNNPTPATKAGNTLEPEKPERGVEIDRSPKPDARDDEKVERLKADDWRADQPMPSAKNARDPRGENTPEELLEDAEERESK